MMLKVDTGYLDISEDPEIEKSFMLLEEVATASGDFSYSFQLPLTHNNIQKLGSDNINRSNKSIYNKINCQIEDDGNIIYRGFLWVQRRGTVIEASFFSGNSNWISQIQGNAIEIDMFDLSVERNIANIISSWDNTEGVIFPFMDTGLLADRMRILPDKILYEEDFQGQVFVKTVMQRLFREYNIKITGELLNDPLYNQMTLTSNNVQGIQDLLNDRYARLAKVNIQTFGTSYGTIVQFTDETSYPNRNAGIFNTSVFKYIADVPMRVTGTVYLEAANESDSFYVGFSVNGDNPRSGESIGNGTAVLKKLTTGRRYDQYVDLQAGDEVYVVVKASSGTVDIVSGYIEIVPIAFLNVIPQSLIGNINKADFISSIFTMFNVISSYDEFTKTLTLNLFKNLKDKEPIELDGIVQEVDYESFISNYGKITKFIIQEPSVTLVEDYNKLNDTVYGGGNIQIDNDYIAEEAEIEIDFSTGYSYENEPFQTQLVNHNFLEFSESGSPFDYTTQASFANVRFDIAEDQEIAVGDWVRILDGDVDLYLGSTKVKQVQTSIEASMGTFYFIIDVLHQGNQVGKAVKLEVNEVNNDNAYMNLVVPKQEIVYNISSLISSIDLSDESFTRTTVTEMAYAYNNLVFGSTILSQSLKYTLLFDNLNIPGYYQIGLIQNYYQDVVRIFNDPVMLVVECMIPYKTFIRLSSLTPIRYQYENGFGLFYLNKISGYRGSEYPCIVELIKM